VKAALAGAPAGLRVQVEVESEEDAQAAVDAGADFLLLDNCSLDVLRRIAQRLRGSALLEASGGVNLANVRAVAETGVQRISIGALTHSAPAADLALELTLGGVRK
jgi:nicotinate-nucleotide pyrophosphorylase (carboxylating)